MVSPKILTLWQTSCSRGLFFKITGETLMHTVHYGHTLQVCLFNMLVLNLLQRVYKHSLHMFGRSMCMQNELLVVVLYHVWH